MTTGAEDRLLKNALKHCAVDSSAYSSTKVWCGFSHHALYGSGFRLAFLAVCADLLFLGPWVTIPKLLLPRQR